MREEDIPLYWRMMAELKEKYKSKMEVLCGIE